MGVASAVDVPGLSKIKLSWRGWRRWRSDYSSWRFVRSASLSECDGPSTGINDLSLADQVVVCRWHIGSASWSLPEPNLVPDWHDLSASNGLKPRVTVSGQVVDGLHSERWL